MKKSKGRLVLFLGAMAIAAMVLFTGCGESSNNTSSGDAPSIDGLKFQNETPLDFATQFHIYNYEDGFKVLDIKDDAQYLVVPEGKKAPEKTPEGLKVIQRPKKIYNAATASMALFAAMDGMDSVTMSSIDRNSWTFDAPKKAMDSGKMKFAGKYSEPDYEMLVGQKCDLAIESTMIYHSPDVKEMIEDLGITVMVDHSSYEENPLGKTEWIKFYGALLNKEDAANKYFEKEKKLVDLENKKSSGKTVAFFYISTDGKAVVKSGKDSVSAMIDMAGGDYIFQKVTSESGRNSIPMTMEQFYSTAKDADIIVYNGTIDKSVKNMKSLLAKDPVMKDLKAVKNNNCWVTGSSMYQRTDIVGEMIQDFRTLFSKENPTGMTFITKLK